MSIQTTIKNQTIKDLVNANSIDSLLRLPKDYTISASDLDAINQALWDKLKAEMQADPVRIAEHKENNYTFTAQSGSHTLKVRAIDFNGSTMRFTTKTQGAKPENGYPLVISLHGGGGTTNETNNQQWLNQQAIWGHDTPLIYVCPRAIANVWNMHFLPNSYPMYDRIIENMIAFEDVDPNKVMIMGFSAGGDGLYQITPRMSDRFCATNMMAGSPNGVSLVNNRNIPFLMGVGGNDTAYNRNKLVPAYDKTLNNYQKTDPDGYVHEALVFPNGGHYTPWAPSTVVGSSQPNTVYADPVKWADSGDTATKKVNTESITWMEQYTRSTAPNKVVFDSVTRANSRKGVNSTNNQRLWRGLNRAYQFYWVNIGANSNTYGEVVVSADKTTNTITISEMGDYVRLLLSPEIVDVTKTINIKVGNQTLQFTPELTLKTMVRTLVDRCDPDMVFPVNLFIEKSGTDYSIIDMGKINWDNAVGGSGPTFQDNPPLGARLTQLNIHSGDVLDNLQAVYGSTEMPAHGGPGGGPSTIKFATDEYITELSGKSGNYFGARHIVQLYVKTNKNTYGPYGTGRFATGIQGFTLTPPTGQKIVAFKGSTFTHFDGTDYIASLGIGTSFDDGGTSQTVNGSGSGSQISGTDSEEVIFTADVTLTRPVADVNVKVDFDHSNTGKLSLELVSPQGTSITLFASDNSAEDDFNNTIFDDQAGSSISSASSPYSGSYKPEQPLSAFIGECPSGSWALRIKDENGSQIGVMKSWQLYVTTY